MSTLDCRQRGASATELALLLPMLVILTLGGTDLGRAVHGFVALSNVARTAAEYGAMREVTQHTRPFWESQVFATGLEEAERTPSLDTSQINMVVSLAEDDAELNEITVEATYPFEMLVHWPGLPQSFMMRRSVTMRQIR